PSSVESLRTTRGRRGERMPYPSCGTRTARTSVSATLEAPPEIPLEPAPAEPRARRPRPLLIAGAASLSAGFVHAAAIGAHSDHPQAARAFVGVAMLQFAWGAFVLVRPSRQLAWIGVALNGGLVAAWVVAKTSGLWFISGL